MIRKPHTSRDRRSFFRDASLFTAAAMGGANYAGLVLGAEVADEQPQNDQVGTIDLGAKPTFVCSGPVTLPRTHNMYVSFHATRIRSDGRVMGDGTALIQFGVCVDHRTLYSVDESVSGIDIESLGVCDTYEVQNSSWAASWNGIAAGDGEAPSVRHFIITFLGMYPGLCERAANFECLAESAKGYFVRSRRYSHVVRYVDFLEVRHQRALARRR